MSNYFSEEKIATDLERRRLNEATKPDVYQASFQTQNGWKMTTYIKPVHTPRDQWHIFDTPICLLENAPSLGQVNRQVAPILRGKHILTFGSKPEREALTVLQEIDEDGDPICRLHDLMLWSAPLVSRRWNFKYGTWHFPKMVNVAREFGLSYDAPGPHDAGADAAMILKIYDFLQQVDVHWAPSSTDNVASIMSTPGSRANTASDFPDDIPF